MNAHQAIRPISISAAVFGMDEDGGGSQGGDDASLDNLFSEDQDANAQSPVEAEHGVEKITLSDDEETEVEVKETCRVLPTPGDQRMPKEKSIVHVATFRTARGARNVWRPVLRENFIEGGLESALRAYSPSITST